MKLRICKNDDSVLSVDCISHDKTFTFNSPGEYIADILNFDWFVLHHLYGELIYATDVERKSKAALSFHQHFLSLSKRTRDFVHYLLFSHSPSKTPLYLQRHLLYYLPHEYCHSNPSNLDVPLDSYYLERIESLCHLVSCLIDMVQSKDNFEKQCYLLDFTYNSHLRPYPGLDCKECFDIIGKWLYRNQSDAPHLQEYNAAVSQILSLSSSRDLTDALHGIISLIPQKEEQLSDFFEEQVFWTKETEWANFFSSFVDSFFHFLKTTANDNFKVFVAAYLYDLRNNLNKEDSDIYLCDNFLEMLCCSFLCCHKYHTPIAVCTICQKFYPRAANSQKICKAPSCKSLAKSSDAKLSKELLGKDLYAVLASVYKRLTYTGTGIHYTRDENAYCKHGLTPECSAFLVSAFSEMKNEYVTELSRHISHLKRYPTAVIAQEDNPYIEAVHAWINKINASCQKKVIAKQIQDIYENNKPLDEKVLVMDKFHFDLATHGWEIYTTPLILPLKFQ